jgi:hypothetical protein
MLKFVRENPTIAFGLGLPLLLVLVFLLVSGIPTLLVAPPQYDVLYTTEYYNGLGGVQIAVVNQKVQVTYLPIQNGIQNPRLWRYSPATGGVREIAITLPAGIVPPAQTPITPGTIPPPVAPVAPVTIDVPDLAGLTVDSSSIAPDGYEFRSGSNGYSGDIFTGLFYGSRYRSDAVLTKRGRSIRLPNAGNVYYGTPTRFIGWVVAQ